MIAMRPLKGPKAPTKILTSLIIPASYTIQTVNFHALLKQANIRG